MDAMLLLIGYNRERGQCSLRCVEIVVGVKFWLGMDVVMLFKSSYGDVRCGRGHVNNAP